MSLNHHFTQCPHGVGRKSHVDCCPPEEGATVDRVHCIEVSVPYRQKESRKDLVHRLLHFLSSWTDSYPHDFTSACSRALLGRTLTQLYELPHIRNTIQGIPWQRRFGRIDCTTETDTAWGLPDNGDAAADALTEQSTAVEERRPSLAPSLVPSLISDTSTLTDISGTYIVFLPLIIFIVLSNAFTGHLTPLVSRRGGTNEERKARFATLLTSPNGFYPDDRRPLARSAAHKLSPGQRHIILVDSASRLMLQEPSATAEYITYRAKQLFSRIGVSGLTASESRSSQRSKLNFSRETSCVTY